MNGAASRVFISYRRDDASGHAGRLYDAVAGHLGDANVFMDVEMKPGIDFVERITQAVGACRVLLVVIGPNWASPGSGKTEPRIAAPTGYVRLEVRTGLRSSDVSVIPLLVAGARMPDPDALPEDLRDLARLNALELSDLRWRYDVGRLMSALDEALVEPSATVTAPGTPAATEGPTRLSSITRRPAVIAAALALAIAAGVAVVLLSSGDPNEPRAPSGDSSTLSVAKPGDTPPGVQVDIRNSAGEQPTLTFDGIEGERIAPDVRNVTAPANISIVDPADETILSPWGFETPTLLLPETCPAPAGCPVRLKRSGTHDVIITGDGDETGSLDLRLYSIAPDIREEIALGTPPVRVDVGVGQAAAVRFSRPAGYKQIILRFLEVELDGYVNVHDPDGGLALKKTEFLAADGGREFRVNVTRTGTYTIYIQGNDLDTGAVRMELGAP